MRRLVNKIPALNLNKSSISSMRTRPTMKDFQITNNMIAAISANQLVGVKILLASSQYLRRASMPLS